MEIASDDLKYAEPLGSQFRFPIAFSADLSQFSILRTVYTLEVDLSLAKFIKSFESTSLLCQRLDLSPIWYLYPKCHHLLHLQGLENECPRWYRLEFSPCGQFIAAARRRGLPQIVDSSPDGTWSITTYRKQRVTIRSKQTVLWEVLSEVTAHSSDFRAEGTFAFHPTLPMLAITGDLETFLWNFGTDPPGKPFVPISLPG